MSSQTVDKSDKASLKWETLLCEQLGKSSDRLLAVRSTNPSEKQFWLGKLVYGSDKYTLKDEFKLLKDRDVVADLRLLVQQVQVDQWKDINVSVSSKEASREPLVAPGQASLPSNKRSVLDIAHANFPKLNKSNWIEWNSLVEIVITPCSSSLDIMTGRVKEGDTLYSKEIEMELFIFLYQIVGPEMRNKMDGVKKIEGLKGSAAYRVLHHECHLPILEQITRNLILAMKVFYYLCVAIVMMISTGAIFVANQSRYN